MKKVVVHGADGSDSVLAFVRESGRTVYVCPLDRYQEAAAGCDDAVVGFPVADVSDVPKRDVRSASHD